MFFEKLIVRIQSSGRSLELTKGMNVQMSLIFGESSRFANINIATYGQLYYYSVTIRCSIYNSISAIVFI